MKNWKFNYPEFFWEAENAHIKKLSPSEFREYLDQLRVADDLWSKAKLKEIIRKMIERGSCFEGTLFLLKDEVKEFLENERIWFLDERREPLWKEYANLPKDHPLKRMRDGSRLSSASSS
jgi:hypothetical protein